jgi:hypothetical protein
LFSKAKNLFLLEKLNKTYKVPSNFGFSPGAEFLLINFNALTCVNAKTVAATNHGKPSID